MAAGTHTGDVSQAVIHGIAIVKASSSTQKATILNIAHNTAQFGFWGFGASGTVGVGRHAIQHEGTELLADMSGKRQDIAFTGQYVCIYGEQPGIYAVAVCNTDYPPRVALSMCYEVLTLFKSEAGSSWASAVTDNAFPDFKGCENALETWKNPVEKDKITAVHAKTSEVKEQLVLALDRVLARGERIDDLVAKSEDLSDSSKQFYKKSKSLNSCCLIV